MTIDITEDLVAALLREQHSDLAHLPLSLGAVGWDNQLWRLGEDLAVRLPWKTEDADELLLKEYGLLPALASLLPLPIPTPQRLGRPGERFPRTWIVTTWVRGEPAGRAPVAPGTDAETALAAFLAALHRPAPPDAPAGRHGRGGSLAATGQGVAHFLDLAIGRGLIDDPQALRNIWEDAASAPDWSGPPVWIHADLHPANVLTQGGEICGVVDFGDLCAGDPACDLASAWLLLPAGATDNFYRAYEPGVDDATIRRARGWALSKALVCLVIGYDGIDGRIGGKPTWATPAASGLKRLVGT